MKLFKTKFIFAMLLITILFAIPTFSKNTLKNDEYGFWLEDDKGYYFVNTWMWVEMTNNGVFYHCYFGDNGYMLINTIAPDGTQINEYGQAVVNGVPLTYTTNALNKTTNSSNYLINLGDRLQDALNVLHNNSIDYSTPISNCIAYYDDEGKYRLYYFDSVGKCVVDIDAIQCDVNGATILMNDRMSREKAPLINHFKEGNKENYVYMKANGYNEIYGRLFEKNISTNGWYTFCDLMFNMDYYDLLTVLLKLESLIY